MAYKRLIEHRLPLAEVSTESAREKSIRHGHISTLHIWWARRPLAACRAAVFATLVPDTDENYELVKKIVPWEAVKDGNSPDILEARRKVLEANGGVPPKVLDPFGGGGAIPLEALRLGCEVYSLDLNPVAHIIQKATLEFPQKFGQPNSRPVPEYIFEKDRQVKASGVGKVSTKNKGKATQQGGLGLGSSEGEWERAYKQNPLATDVRYWGEWVLEKARKELKEFYPSDIDGKVPVAYLWVRTVTCANPACRAEIPLSKHWWLAKRPSEGVALKPYIDAGAKRVNFTISKVSKGDEWPEEGTMQRDNARCLVCDSIADGKYLRASGKAGEFGERILAIALSEDGKQGKSYRIANELDKKTFEAAKSKLDEVELDTEFDGYSAVPKESIIEWSGVFNAPLYGLNTWGSLFNARQLLSMVKFVEIVRTAYKEIIKSEDENYAKAIAVYLGIAVDRLADKNSNLVFWHHIAEFVDHVFARQALSMTWNYAEAPVLGSIGWKGALEWIQRSIEMCSKSSEIFLGEVIRGTATNIPMEDNYLDAIITDPPYYDAVPYSDLSDFFYVWLKRSIGYLYPEHFRTPATPKAQEAVQHPLRHQGNNEKAKTFFEETMAKAFREMHRVLKPGGEATIVFAHKSTDAWETLINALIQSGFKVESSWPIRTEMANRIRAKNSAVLASSTFINCLKRSSGGIGYFQEVRNDMVVAIRPQLAEFWSSGIRGADFFMSAIGPGLESYSKHDEVRRVSGEVVTVGEFLDEVRKIVMEFALEHVLGAKSLGAVDAATQFGLLSLWGYGPELPSDEARKLAQSVGIELSELEGLVKVSGDKAKVLTLKERAKNKHLGLSRNGEAVSMIDAMHKAVALLGQGSRQAVSDYLAGHNFLNSEAYWQTMQALAEVQDGADDGRALHELLTIRDNLPKPGNTAAQTLLGAN